MNIQLFGPSETVFLAIFHAISGKMIPHNFFWTLLVDTEKTWNIFVCNIFINPAGVIVIIIVKVFKARIKKNNSVSWKKIDNNALCCVQSASTTVVWS